MKFSPFITYFNNSRKIFLKWQKLFQLHGRSREQRYTRLADWDYISKCAQAAGSMPLFGNGDILSYEDVNLHREASGVSGVMVAR